jgi:hypothetical protein
MTQSMINGLVFGGNVGIADGANLDPFSRLRVSEARNLFDSQFTYNLNPLLFEQLVSGSGASIAHDTTERVALMTFTSTPTGGTASMQTYEWFRYQPGNGQLIFLTFNFIEHATDVLKFVGYGDLANNGVHLISDGSGLSWRILSDTTHGDETVAQANWNLDPLDGSGGSGITLDVSKTHIAVIDVQALYVGRVRVGFDIDGQVIYCHEFLHANSATYPYIQTASLPLIAGMTCSGTASTTMQFICATVKSEGGPEEPGSYTFAIEGTATAASGARTHILSLRPKTTFNSLVNRLKFELTSVNVLVTGNNPVLWELCLGQVISGTTTFSDANATYSAFEYNSAGTISGSPAIVIASGYVPANNQAKGEIAHQVVNRYPITLDAAGAVRALGTLSLLVTGIGGTSACRASFNWREVR